MINANINTLTGTRVTQAPWILATGVWNDNGKWNDNAIWID